MNQHTPRPSAPRLRVLLGNSIAIGPGKAELLNLIVKTGSIAGAAREMGMSYRRAWNLVSTMNNAFRQPVVQSITGGKGGGGAALTLFGRDALQRYQAMESKALKSVAKEMDEFFQMLNSNYSAVDDPIGYSGDLAADDPPKQNPSS